jgi:uncharacterized protein YkwD
VRVPPPWTAALLVAATTLAACSSGSRGGRVPEASTRGVPAPTWSKAGTSAPRAPALAPAPRTVAIAPATPASPPAIVRPSAPSPAPAPVAAPDDRDLGRAMLDAVNRERVARGLRALRWNERLHRAAYEHSAEQDRYGYLGHGSPDPARDDLRARERMAGYEPRKWAEVVGWNYEGAEHVCEGWMDSRGHRAILLDPSLVDAGVARVGTYYTGDFGIAMDR